ncbi:hypothetical protein B566_EDAN015578 [Ephemera danica]|nr:hypothetical protein B566_EDAN015578 [Ephemera danica]
MPGGQVKGLASKGVDVVATTPSPRGHLETCDVRCTTSSHEELEFISRTFVRVRERTVLPPSSISIVRGKCSGKPGAIATAGGGLSIPDMFVMDAVSTVDLQGYLTVALCNISEQPRFFLPHSNLETGVLYAPKVLVPEILKRFHDNPTAGHRGLAKNLDLVRRHFYWPGLYTDVKTYIKKCLKCLQFKANAPPPIPLQKFTSLSRPLQQVALDIVGPFPVSLNCNNYILTMQDTFTRYPEAKAIPNITADTVARAFVEYFICRYGPPETLLCDRGSQFTSELMRKICELLGIRQVFTSAFHPAGNGLLERSHKSLSSVIANYIRADHRDWDDQICFALLVYRNTVHSSIKHTPNYMMTARHIDMPWEDIFKPKRPCYAEDENYVDSLQKRLQLAHEQAKIHNEHAVELSHSNYNKKAQDPDISEGDLVMFKNVMPNPNLSRKLSPNYVGPFRVTRLRSPVTVDLENLDTGKSIQAHISNLLKLGSQFTIDTQNPVSDVRKERTQIEPTPPVATHPLSDQPTDPNVSNNVCPPLEEMQNVTLPPPRR